jgi:putative DNA primase/helicase
MPDATRPVALPVNPRQIPDSLKALSQWVCWRYDWRVDRWTKPPYQPNGREHARVDEPATWSTFEKALQGYQRGDVDGVGLVLTPELGLVGVDLDHCRDGEAGGIAPWASAIVRRLASYAEVSPSGTGLRIWLYGTLPPAGRRKGPIELYSGGRYLTLTGCHLAGTTATVERRQAVLDAWHQEIFGEPKAPGNPSANGHAPDSPMSDGEILKKALGAKNGGKFAQLWSGDFDGYSSHSEGDEALCALLSFWTQDAGQIDRLFRRSGLYREKWERADYREHTIAHALQCSDHWTPPHDHQASEHGDEQQEAMAGAKSKQQLGGVKAKRDGYYRVRMIKEAWIETQISSFIVRPTLRIWVDGSEAVRAKLQRGKQTLAEVTIERQSWHSRNAFLKVLPSLDQWCVASDNEIQAIQALVASRTVPTKQGTRTLGLVDGLWVVDDGVLDASGWVANPSLVYLPPSGEWPLAGHLRYRLADVSDRPRIAKAFYTHVWTLNELIVMGALVGWFFATRAPRSATMS